MEDREQLLEYAKNHYPVGTKFREPPLVGRNSSEFTATRKPQFYWKGEDYMDVCDTYGIIYFKGQWAEIISSPILETTDYQIF